MRDVAEAAVTELKGHLGERDRALEALRERMAQETARWLARHQVDRHELERLNQRLFERNGEAIGGMRVRGCWGAQSAGGSSRRG